MIQVEKFKFFEATKIGGRRVDGITRNRKEKEEAWNHIARFLRWSKYFAARRH